MCGLILGRKCEDGYCNMCLMHGWYCARGGLYCWKVTFGNVCRVLVIWGFVLHCCVVDVR